MTELPHGCVRHPSRGPALYLPGPRRGWLRRFARPTLKLAALGLTLLGVSTAEVADSSALATLRDARPAWATALRAPDPGVALSPHFEPLQDGFAPTLADAEIARGVAPKGDRLMTPVAMTGTGRRGSVTQLPGLLSPVDREALPRVAFVRPRVPETGKGEAGASPPHAPPSALAEAALTSMLAAYATDRVDIEEPFRLLMGSSAAVPEEELSDTGTRAYGISGKGRDHWWSDRPLPKDVASEESVTCLAQAIYFEARGESELGQKGVAQVVINRVKNPAYPDDVCGVVYQNRKWFNRCQFTFACDRIKDVVRDPEAWETAMTIAKGYAEQTMWIDDVGASTHYHTVNVSPKWAPIMRRVKTIGDHIFYITRNGGWT
ncbi:cell wall hydrolase [Acuticoccus kandeliae]|uniref:cell wall hydrolase n=1 Tax=Acuticoccus kandeliae TaxID=2073160 RepID=UPI00130078B8|nr:cell wall hydrolase [Acuticoccus kandeliae]